MIGEKHEMKVEGDIYNYICGYLSASVRKTALKLIKRVILGVTIRDDLHAVDHIDKLVSSCTRSLYALRVLRSQGLHNQVLHVVTEAITMADCSTCHRLGGASHRQRTGTNSIASNPK